MFDLTGRVALVTGSGRGVGAGIARALSRQGAKLAINDYFPERAAEMAAELKQLGREAVGVPFDVTDMAAVNADIADIEATLGAVEILVNNVGTLPHGMLPTSFEDMPEAMWKQHIDNNFGVCDHPAYIIKCRYRPRGDWAVAARRNQPAVFSR